MDQTQIALLVILLLLGTFILLIGYKFYNIFAEKKDKFGLQNNITKFTFTLGKTFDLRNADYSKMELTCSEIQYCNQNKERLVFQFQTDENKNQKFCKYMLSNENKIIYSNDSDDVLETKELTFFSNFEMIKNQTYFYNYPITQQALNDGDQNVLDAFIMYLNQENWKNFIFANGDKKIDKLFLPSSILQEEDQIQMKFEKFLFYFKPIQYQMDILYKRLFFITKSKIRQNNIILFEINLELKTCYIHSTIRNKECKENYNELCNKMKLLINYDDNLYPVICSQCNLRSINEQQQQNNYYAGCFLAYGYNYETNEKQYQSLEELKNFIQGIFKLNDNQQAQDNQMQIPINIKN